MDLQSAKRTEPSLQIIPLPVRFVLKQYPRGEPLPGDVLEALQAPPPAGPALGSPDGESRTRAKAVGSGPSAGAFLSITATAEEWSLMRSARPDEADEAEWGCIRVRGPMELSLTGIAADLTKSLTRVGTAVFIISTWNTDWIFVKHDAIDKSVRALAEDGWVVCEA